MKILVMLLHWYTEKKHPGYGHYTQRRALAKQAFNDKDYARAGKYAEELLGLAGTFGRDWNDGNAIYHGNHILGLLALWQKDVSAACQYLLAAGRTPGSPQLNSFGPNFQLAAELIEKGKREVGLQFIDLIAVFWATEPIIGKDQRS